MLFSNVLCLKFTEVILHFFYSKSFKQVLVLSSFIHIINSQFAITHTYLSAKLASSVDDLRKKLAYTASTQPPYLLEYWIKPCAGQCNVL